MADKESILKQLNLPSEECGYLKYREDDEYFYIDIGRSDEIDAMWKGSFDRMKALEDKYKQKLLDILADLQAEEKKSLEEKNLPMMSAIAVTPSKGTPAKGGRKRPAPLSSSVNKVILHRAKRSSSKVAKKVLDGNTTPAKLATAGSSSTHLQLTPSPYSLRRQVAEPDDIKEKLIASESKLKKADEKKQDLLRTRAQALKEQRELRMEKIRQNKLALEQQAKEAAAAKALAGAEASEGSHSASAEKGSQRYQLRRRILDKVASTKKLPGPKTRSAKARAAAESSTRQASGDDGIENSFTRSKKGSTAKRGLANKASTKKKKNKPASKVLAKVASEESNPKDKTMVLSPIVCKDRPVTGINQRLNETFTNDAAVNSNGEKTTSAVLQTAPPPKATSAATMPMPLPSSNYSTLYMTNTSNQNATSSISQYNMSPPPKTASVENYEISKYIDSDDEEGQMAAEVMSAHKRIPDWVQGKAFLVRLNRQFRQSPEALAAQVARLFPANQMPVPLEEMGLPVREPYASRSSSVDWKKIAEIEEQLKSGGGGSSIKESP